MQKRMPRMYPSKRALRRLLARTGRALAIAVPAVLLLHAACLHRGGSHGEPEPVSGAVSRREFLEDLSGVVILPTYAAFSDQAARLRQAVEDLASIPAAQTLETAQDAWVEARQLWDE